MLALDYSQTRRFLTAVFMAVALGSLVSSASAASPQPDPSFARANEEFAKGKFGDAIRDYETLVNSKQWSAPLFYNLGNAYFRAGDLGKSILSYERALALDPNQPETAANLALAREDARALELQRDRIDTLFKHATANEFTVIGSVAFWLGLFALMWYIFMARRSAMLAVLFVLCCLVAVGSAVAVYRIEADRASLAIVTGKEVQARLATADNANSVLQLPPGSEVRVLSQRGDWIYALLPNNLRGWIPTTNVQPVRI
jgi:tetratricopeptide (TPR) repeat protein